MLLSVHASVELKIRVQQLLLPMVNDNFSSSINILWITYNSEKKFHIIHNTTTFYSKYIKAYTFLSEASTFHQSYRPLHMQS